MHTRVQIAWFVLLAILGIAMAVSAGDECDGLGCLFEDRAFVSSVVIYFGTVVWVAGALVIALVSLVIGWVVRRVRGTDPPGEPG